MIHPFPDNLVIELEARPGTYVAKSWHVTNTPVQPFQPAPVVVQTFGKGDTPVDALDDLLDNIVKGERS